MENHKKEKKPITDQEIEQEGYTKDEIPFADGKDTKLNDTIDDASQTSSEKDDK